MKILAIADTEEKILWDYYDRERTRGVDLIISCGDLKPQYLEFLVTMVNCPLLYVRGNHDDIYRTHPPQGCICIEDTVYDFEGLRIMGLGGSMRYKNGENMYTEREMRNRVMKLKPRIAVMNGFDMLVTHAPAKGYGDLPDLCHQGFEIFDELMFRYRPAYMLHGHIHSQYGRIQTEYEHTGGTMIRNVNGYRIIEVGEEHHPKKGKTGSFFYDLYVSLKGRTEAVWTENENVPDTSLVV